MAIELTRKRLQAAIDRRSQPIRLPSSTLAAILAAAAVIALVSLLSGIHNAQRDERVSRARALDAQTLLGLPPVSTSVLQSELADANSQLLYAQRIAERSVNASSDEVIAGLVRQAASAGVAVRGISRVAPATAKFGDRSYDASGIRVAVEGRSDAIANFLLAVMRESPTLFPSLASMTIGDAGVARADLAFSAYDRALATPAVPAPAQGGKR